MLEDEAYGRGKYEHDFCVQGTDVHGKLDWRRTLGFSNSIWILMLCTLLPTLVAANVAGNAVVLSETEEGNRHFQLDLVDAQLQSIAHIELGKLKRSQHGRWSKSGTTFRLLVETAEGDRKLISVPIGSEGGPIISELGRSRKAKLGETALWFDESEDGEVLFVVGAKGSKRFLWALAASDHRQLIEYPLEKGKLQLTLLANKKLMVAYAGKKVTLIDGLSGKNLFAEKFPREKNPKFTAVPYAPYFVIQQHWKVRPKGRDGNADRYAPNKLIDAYRYLVIRSEDGETVFADRLGYNATSIVGGELSSAAYLATRPSLNDDGATVWKVTETGIEEMHHTEHRCRPDNILLHEAMGLTTIICLNRRVVHFDELGDQYRKRSIPKGPVQYNSIGSAIYSIAMENGRFVETPLKPLGASRSGNTGRSGARMAAALPGAILGPVPIAILSLATGVQIAPHLSIDGVQLNEDNTKAFVLSMATNDITVFDLLPLTRRGYIPVGGGARQLSSLSEGDTLVVLGKARALLIDGDKQEIIYELNDIEPLSIAPENGRLYYADANGLHIMDLATQEILASNSKLSTAVSAQVQTGE